MATPMHKRCHPSRRKPSPEYSQRRASLPRGHNPRTYEHDNNRQAPILPPSGKCQAVVRLGALFCLAGSPVVSAIADAYSGSRPTNQNRLIQPKHHPSNNHHLDYLLTALSDSQKSNAMGLCAVVLSRLNPPILLGLGWCGHSASAECSNKSRDAGAVAPATPPLARFAALKQASYGTDRGPSPQSPYAETGPR